MKITVKTFRNWLGKQFYLCFHISQQRPRFSKLGLKGLSDYHSNKIAVEAARQEPTIQIKKAALTEYLLKKRELDTALSLTEKGQKAAHQKKIPLVRKSFSL
jgi:hypothetical protein